MLLVNLQTVLNEQKAYQHISIPGYSGLYLMSIHPKTSVVSNDSDIYPVIYPKASAPYKR